MNIKSTKAVDLVDYRSARGGRRHHVCPQHQFRVRGVDGTVHLFIQNNSPTRPQLFSFYLSLSCICNHQLFTFIKNIFSIPYPFQGGTKHFIDTRIYCSSFTEDFIQHILESGIYNIEKKNKRVWQIFSRSSIICMEEPFISLFMNLLSNNQLKSAKCLRP